MLGVLNALAQSAGLKIMFCVSGHCLSSYSKSLYRNMLLTLPECVVMVMIAVESSGHADRLRYITMEGWTEVMYYVSDQCNDAGHSVGIL